MLDLKQNEEENSNTCILYKQNYIIKVNMLKLNILTNKKQIILLCLIFKIKCAVICTFDFFYLLRRHCRGPPINQFTKFKN